MDKRDWTRGVRGWRRLKYIVYVYEILSVNKKYYIILKSPNHVTMTHGLYCPIPKPRSTAVVVLCWSCTVHLKADTLFLLTVHRSLQGICFMKWKWTSFIVRTECS